mmetsp:Transcript_6820/g.12838  ORF Transcript_6820/g.12838 Transcript_6820/m.12838 type:complete len:245 (+) Transcript_6820:2392-3126(+)
MMICNPKELAKQITILIRIQKFMIIRRIQFELSIIPPTGIISNIHGTKQSHILQMPPLFKLLLHLGHTNMMCSRFLTQNTLLIHELNIIFLRQRQGHPKVRICIQFPLLLAKFLTKFITQSLQQGSRNRKTPQTRPHSSNISQNLEHLGSCRMIDLFDLCCISPRTIGHSNDTILVQSLLHPFLFGRCLISQQGTHDIGMMSRDILERCRWDKDLISPEYGKTTFTRRCIDSGLFHDCFQYCNG